MFKRAILEMSRPICNCREQRLGISLVYERNTGANLRIKCKGCGTQQLISNNKFVYMFQFDTPYPDEQERTAMDNVIVSAAISTQRKQPATASGTIDGKTNESATSTQQPQVQQKQSMPSQTSAQSTKEKSANPYLTNFKL